MKKITIMSVLISFAFSFSIFANNVEYPLGTFECVTEFTEFRDMSIEAGEDFPIVGDVFEKPIKTKTSLFIHFNGETGNAKVLNPLTAFPNWMLFNKENTKKINRSAVLVLEESSSLYYVLDWDTWYYGSSMSIETKSVTSKKIEANISITDNDGVSEELNKVNCSKI